MNYRNKISEHIPSLEYIFTEYLKADANYHEQSKTPSNRHTIYYLIFGPEAISTNMDEQTLLRNSIFKDTFLEQLYKIDLTAESQYEEPLLYYIVHRNEPFPTNSKYSQFLSNIFQKNFTGKGQPPQVRTILNAIDATKLSLHIDTLIQQQTACGNDVTTQLSTYITNIIQTEPKFTEISGISSKDSIADCLCWILLYALFDEISFETYCQYNRDTSTAATEEASTRHSAFTDSDSTISQQNSQYIHTLSQKCRNATLYSKITSYSLLVLTTIQLVCFIIPFFLYGTQVITDQRFLLFCIAMLVASVVLLTLRYIPYYFARQAADYKVALSNLETNQVPELPISEYKRQSTLSFLYEKQKKYRILLIIILAASWIFAVIASIYAISLPVLCAGILISFAIYLHCDHIVRLILYSNYYIHITEAPASPKKPQFLHALCMRFLWDYDSDKQCFTHRRTSDLPNHSIDSIRFIFYSHVDRQEYLWTGYTVFSLLLNCIVLFISIIQFILPFNSYFRISDAKTYSIFCIVWMIISNIVYITLLLQTNQHYDTYMEYMNYSLNPSLKEDFLKKAYDRDYHTGKISNIDIGRGIFQYNCSMWEKHITSTSIFPIDDRELVIHRYHEKLERITLASIAWFLAFLCIVVWHFHILRGLWMIPVLAILYPLFAFKLLPWIDERFMLYCVRRYNCDSSQAGALSCGDMNSGAYEKE
jgi:hypothetical protein